MTAIITADYNGTQVFFQDDAWLNATTIAAHFGKKPNDWLRLPATQEYLSALCAKYEAGKSRFIKTSRGKGKNGTWLHRKLAVPFARWLDVHFAIWCDEKIEQILIGSGVVKTTPDERTELRQAVTEAAAKLQMMHWDVYLSVHKHFNVNRIEEIPLAELPEAVAFVKALHGQYIACREQADAERRQKIVYRRAAVMMMALGKLYHQKQRKLLREAKETVDKLHELMREIEECNVAISDGVRESQLYLCFDNQVVREV